MKTFVQILKGVMLWVTALSILLFLIGGLESLIDNGQWIAVGIWLTANLILAIICVHTLSYKDVYRLSGSEIIDSLFKTPETFDQYCNGLSDSELKEIWEDMKADEEINRQKCLQ